MGLILDSSVVIAAERRRDTPEQLVQQIMNLAGDQEAGLSSIGLTELVHGIYRADSVQRQLRRRSFVEELRFAFTIYPYTAETATLAGQIDGEQMAKGVTIPFSDLLIGATALSLGFSMMTVNVRHFDKIPNLHVIAIP
jgi:predicted nucleic acid-binding protein